MIQKLGISISLWIPISWCMPQKWKYKVLQQRNVCDVSRQSVTRCHRCDSIASSSWLKVKNICVSLCFQSHTVLVGVFTMMLSQKDKRRWEGFSENEIGDDFLEEATELLKMGEKIQPGFYQLFNGWNWQMADFMLTEVDSTQIERQNFLKNGLSQLGDAFMWGCLLFICSWQTDSG